MNIYEVQRSNVVTRCNLVFEWCDIASAIIAKLTESHTCYFPSFIFHFDKCVMENGAKGIAKIV